MTKAVIAIADPVEAPSAASTQTFRLVSWNMGMSMNAFAEQHDRAWHFLVALNPDIALVQEAVPPDWIRARFAVHHEPFDLWASAVLVRPDWPSHLTSFGRETVIGAFGAYVATTEVVIPGTGDVVVASVHTTAQRAFPHRLSGLDVEAIRRPSLPDVWWN